MHPNQNRFIDLLIEFELILFFNQNIEKSIKSALNPTETGLINL